MGPELYAIQWILTLFCYDLPIEFSTRIIDLFLIDGWKIVFKVILALLNLIKDDAIKLRYEDVLITLKNFTQMIEWDAVICLLTLRMN